MAAGKVPIIDITTFWAGDEAKKEEIAKTLGHACEKVGFFIVTGHGISPQVIKDCWEVVHRYFDMPVQEKNKVPMTDTYPYGYMGFGDEVLVKGLQKNEDTRSAEVSKKSSQAPDLKESFQICIGPETNPSPQMKTPLWPDNPTDFKPKLTAYYRGLEKLATAILELFARALSLPPAFFEDKTNQHLSSLRTLNYPHMDEPPKPGQMRASPHTDYGTITLLLADDAPGGLELLLDGVWHPVKAPADSFIVNLGDLMARWTNNKWVSTMHRVVPPPPETKGSTRRQSMAFFQNINPDAVVATIPTCISADRPKQYEPITAGDWLMTKHYSTYEKQPEAPK